MFSNFLCSPVKNFINFRIYYAVPIYSFQLGILFNLKQRFKNC